MIEPEAQAFDLGQQIAQQAATRHQHGDGLAAYRLERWTSTCASVTCAMVVLSRQGVEGYPPQPGVEPA